MTYQPNPDIIRKAKRLSSSPMWMKPKMDEANCFRYYAAEVARRECMTVPNYSDGEDAIKSDYNLMVRINRDLYQNNPVYRAIINGVCTAIVGEDGCEFSPKVQGLITPEIKQAMQDLFLNWCKFADYSERFSFTEIERLVCTELLVVGSCLLYKANGTKLQLIEVERVKEILTDFAGRITGFVLFDKSKPEGVTTLDASDCIYVSNVDRPSQVRGTGLLWSVCDVCTMLMFILRRSAKAWAIASSYALAFEAENGSAVAAAMNNIAGSDGEESDPDAPVYPKDPTEGRSACLDDVSMFFGKPGEKVSVVNHTGVPNVQLGEHVLTYLRIISSVIGVDAATFVQADFSRVTYASSRSANIAMSRVVRKFQNQLSYTFYRPTALWLLGSWRSNPATIIPDDVSVLNSINFIFPKPPIIDGKQEADANEKELALGLVTHNELLLSRNKDPQAYYQARVAEILEADRLVEEIRAKTNGRIILPWQTLCGLGSQKTAVANDIAQRDQQTEPKKAEEKAA